ncbi:hypothetical protein KFE25_002227 [Diacronema lutheri]|uniref:ShKT domain-containing protein n=1 Tax=Diacronema lutheri TaxID=2081491 RepID=A0A8J5XM12_DIALT|nr:hypothetical protein KFE25_002227 [Diacronema lutheri]
MADAEFGALAASMDRIFAPCTHTSMRAFRADPRALGPTFVECGSRGRPAALRRAYGAWPRGGERAAVPLRSVSQTFAAVALLADGAGARCASARAGGARVRHAADWRNASVLELLSMSARAFDNGVNSAWRNLSHAADHNGLPTPCDSADSPLARGPLAASVRSCLEQLVLPTYDRAPACAGLGLRDARERLAARALARALVRTAARARDVTCADAHGECCKWARSGECARNRKYMLESCAAACGLCAGVGACDASHGCADADEHCDAWAAAGECTANAQYMAGSCARACGLCGAVGAAVGAARGASVRFEYAPHGPSGRHALTRRAVDPPVGFLPKLRSNGCLTARWCYAPAPTHERAPLGAWEAWAPARPYTRVQVSNALFGSARDMGRLARMLLARGELDGVRVLSRASVELMLGSARAAATAGVLPTECMAMTAFGLGIGWCSDHTAADAGAGALGGTDDCRAPDWYGWAGSYGSRFALMHTLPRAAADARWA